MTIHSFTRMKHLLNDKGIHCTNKTELQTSFQIELVLDCIFLQLVECEESFDGFLFGFDIILWIFSFS